MTLILETDWFLLRHFVMDDLDGLFALYHDPEIPKYFPEGVKNYKALSDFCPGRAL